MTELVLAIAVAILATSFLLHQWRHAPKRWTPPRNPRDQSP